jgi:nicotinate-nucleotide--dimethylbenzimidazole phosphoribosyltransferase
MTELAERLRHAIDFKTKPRGAVGRLEDLAYQIGLVQGTVTPTLADPAILVFAADHGLAREAVSAYPREVTAQMVVNSLAGGAGIDVFCRQHGITRVLVDAGVDWPGQPPAGVRDARIGPGTASSLAGDAMTADELARCLAAGRAAVAEAVSPASNVIGCGEIGIGNTSAGALIVSALTGLPIEQCAGPGTGLVGEGLRRKIELLRAVQARHGDARDPEAVLRAYGGFEIAQMAGAMLAAGERRALLLVDGFVASAAYLCAVTLEPSLSDVAVFCHRSGEPGHARLLEYLGATPLLDLGLRLGEGSGCAVAYPILESAVVMLTEMASFADAGVSTGAPEQSF